MMLVLLVVALLPLVAGGTADPSYVLTIPALIWSNKSCTMCVQFAKPKESLDMEVILEYFEKNITIFKEPISTDFSKCVSFQVPNANSTAPTFISLMARGQNVQVYTRQSVVIAVLSDIHSIQMDKALYKPGDKVNARLISLNNAFQPVRAKCASVHLLDPSSNKMFQLLDLVSTRGVLPFSFRLPSDAELGDYRIAVRMESGEEISQNVPVQEQVLPRFSISINTPSVITILDQTVKYKMSSRYTYNRGVPGNVTSRLCRGYTSYYPGNTCNRPPDGICQTLTGQTDSDGAFHGSFDLANYQFDRSGLNMNLLMQVTLTEAGTGVQSTESKYIYITNQMARATFNRQVMQQYYKPRMPYLVGISVLDAAGQPLYNETVELLVGGKNIHNMTTGEDGSAVYQLDTTNLQDSTISLQVMYKNTEQCYDSNWLTPTYANDYYSITRFYSLTRSYMQVTTPYEELSCGKSYDLKVQYDLSKEGVGEGIATASVSYLIMSKAVIVKHGQHPLDLSHSLNGECSLNLSVSSDLAGGADVVVYLMLQNETIAATLRLTVEKCFKHKIDMKFSKEKAIPGSSVDLELLAAPHSLCGHRVVDSSLSLLKQNHDFTPDTVFNSLKYSFLDGYYVDGYNVAPRSPPCIDPNKRLLIDGVYYQPVGAGNEGDSYGVVSGTGLLMVTNSIMHKPEVCGGNVFHPTFHEFGTSAAIAREVAFAGDSAPPPPSASSIITERKFFPDVWTFNLTEVGDSGKVTLPETVPGTITTWQLTGFCLSADEGIGITKHSSNLTSYMPFFVESSSPYGFTRNEILIYRAFVSNTQNTCIKVGIEMGASKDFTAEMTEGEQDLCVCQNERLIYAWKMEANSIGVLPINVTAWTKSFGVTCEDANDSSYPFRQDSMIRTVIVKAEGKENEMTYSTLVSLTDEAVQIPIHITPPSNTVKDSLKSSLIITGDIMNIPAGSLQSMIRLPTGCGEQSLATLMPIASTMKYLQCKGLLTDAIKAQAIHYMEAGYRRQLAYIRPDGFSSVFGRSASPTSTWLTALCFRTFENLKRYVFVDEAIQNRALLVLERAQDPHSGCYKAEGVIFNHDLQGGATDSISLTAHIVATLVQSEYPGTRSMVQRGLKCLIAASRSPQSLYNRAVMAYTFAVAGNEEESNVLLEQLMQEAIVDEDNAVHWEQSEKQPKNVPFFYAPAPSADIEITSYVLWAMTSHSNPSQESLTYMSSIVHWLVKQMNAEGAFRSTTDTVVAMEAFAAYGCLVQTENTTQQVTLSSSNGVIATFTIDQSNRHLLQSLPLDNNITQYNIDVQGNGSCIIQVKSKFNTPVSEEKADFTLSLATSSKDCDNGVAYLYTITGSCSYQGPGKESNMAIINLKLTSGYKPERESIEKLKNEVNRVEIKGDHVILYLQSVSNKPTNFTFKAEMSDLVLNFQPQSAHIYDYYDPDRLGMAVLYHPCALENKV